MSKVWFVTGSSRGLGRCIAEAALAAGDRVAATARTPSDLDDLSRRWGDKIMPVRLDVTDAEMARRAVAAVVQRFGRIDVVVNNAGKADIAAIEDFTDADFRYQVETVFMGVVNVTRAALPVLRRQGSGHFIQISSVGDRMGSPGLSAYQSSKWAMLGFSTALTAEVAPLGIKVSTLEPGVLRTDLAGGSSMVINEVSEPYKPTVGVVVGFVRDSYLTAPTDPARVARLVVDLTRMAEPPARLLVGADAFESGRALTQAVAENDERWKDLTVSVNS